MSQLLDGQTAQIQGSGKSPYVLKNVGGVYSCSCPAWRNQSLAIERRTCKHLKQLLGETAELARTGGVVNVRTAKPTPKMTVAVSTPSGEDVLLADKWDGSDPSGYWMSEKLDGVRAYWNGHEFRSRQGNLFYAPDWFVKDLPSTPLDGELWLARKAFQKTISIVRRQDKNSQWDKIKYVVFDAPGVGGKFEDRMSYLTDLFGNKKDYASLLAQEQCKDLEHMQQSLQHVEELGGEGLMLREPGSLYVSGRSSSLLKVKTFVESDGRVVDYLAGKGRHEGRLGALVLQMPNGVRFAVGSGLTDAQRDNPPPLGSVVTYKFQELTDGGVPRFPTFLRVRTDLI